MSATYLEQPINKVRVRPILTNTSPQSQKTLNMVKHGHGDLGGSSSLAVIANVKNQCTNENEENIAPSRKEIVQSQRPLLGLSKLKDLVSNIAPLVVGAVALEAVITFSFRSIDGLFLVISTLAVGTSVYVFDGIKR